MSCVTLCVRNAVTKLQSEKELQVGPCALTTALASLKKGCIAGRPPFSLVASRGHRDVREQPVAVTFEKKAFCPLVAMVCVT